MTNERAIQLLHRLQDEQFDGEYGDERREALEMAVRALSSQQTVNDSQGLVNDCISRKQAIEAFEPTHYKDWYTPTIIETLETLPSVQLVKEPDGLVKDLVKDCISRQDAINSLDGFRCGTKAAWKVIEDLPSAQPVNYGSTKSDSSSQLKLNNDLISRQQAIGALNDEYHGMISDESMKIYQIINWISALPSAQPEPSQVARDICTILENEQDMRVILKNAQPQWIPCSEKPPKKNGNYLVTGKHGAVNKRKYEDGRWYGGWDVIAWRELPEPYRGESDE